MVRAHMGQSLTYVGTPTYGSSLALFWFFACTYVLLIFLIGGLLNALTVTNRRWVGDTFLAAIAQARLRWLWVALLVNIAGLPPAFFFGPKVGLLGILLESGLFLFSLALGGSIFVGWVVYFSLGQRSLVGKVAVGTLRLRDRVLASYLACGVVFIFCGLVGGAGFLDDCFLFVEWLAL